MGDLTLNISEVQVLVRYPDDENRLFWHHRVLLHRIAGGQWVTLTPDHELQRHDLGTQAHRVLERSSLFPQNIAAEVYAHDPLPRAQLMQFKRQAQVMASILGEGEVDGLDTLVCIADPTHKNFGAEVGPSLMNTEATGVAFATKGVALVEGEELFVERFLSSSLEAWKASKGKDLGDVRLLGDHRDASGTRRLDLSAAISLMHSPKDEEFPISGTRAAKELHESICEGPGNFLSYHAEWLRLSGVSSRNAAAHVHRNLCDVLRLMHSYDQVDSSSLACGETHCR